ncbi:YbaB/EbfC family nucleoid-associated protein [Actinoplanes sp. M2I2]|uniref:YbaB/EbfC family nucleoid-associated protein n=1 Tax=Actinoplanes sp. M2I2 TaxID=1734444 RepID=UPI00201FE645|nr:YbaB/EbfC family nucleoid-associated protein [Actinoplanes sp. M2I2]
MDGVDAAEEWLDTWVGQVNAQAAQSVELSRRVAALTGTAEGRDGAVRVTVGSAGQIERLELDDRVRDVSGPRLAEEIMSVMRRAQAALSNLVADQVQDTVGVDTETGRAVIQSFETRFPTVEREEDR